VVINPNPRRTIKLLAGDAHRVPTVFEMYLDDSAGGVKPNLALHSEKVRTLEAVWEERLTHVLFATASVYQFKATGLIEQLLDREDYLWQYHNAGTAEARGIELELDYRASRIWSYASYALEDARSQGEWLTNSPRSLAKAGITVPLAGRGRASAELAYDSGRRTVADQVTDPFVGANASLAWSVTPHLHLRAGVRNLFDRRFATPGGVEHAEDVIEQDGRTFQVKATVRF
jgi:iron complex outermembrane receptor protein